MINTFLNAINFLFVDVLFINPHGRAYLGDDIEHYIVQTFLLGTPYTAICNKCMVTRRYTKHVAYNVTV